MSFDVSNVKLQCHPTEHITFLVYDLKESNQAKYRVVRKYSFFDKQVWKKSTKTPNSVVKSDRHELKEIMADAIFSEKYDRRLKKDSKHAYSHKLISRTLIQAAPIAQKTAPATLVKQAGDLAAKKKALLIQMTTLKTRIVFLEKAEKKQLNEITALRGALTTLQNRLAALL